MVFMQADERMWFDQTRKSPVSHRAVEFEEDNDDARWAHVMFCFNWNTDVVT